MYGWPQPTTVPRVSRAGPLSDGGPAGRSRAGLPAIGGYEQGGSMIEGSLGQADPALLALVINVKSSLDGAGGAAHG
jgi:hypothetical protein